MAAIQLSPSERLLLEMLRQTLPFIDQIAHSNVCDLDMQTAAQALEHDIQLTLALLTNDATNT